MFDLEMIAVLAIIVRRFKPLFEVIGKKSNSCRAAFLCG